MRIFKFYTKGAISVQGDKFAFIALNDVDHLIKHMNLPEWEEITLDEFNQSIDSQLFNSIKYISGFEDDEFVAFSPNVDHDRMSIALDFPAKTAGFIYRNGKTYGRSETLNLNANKKVYTEYKKIYTQKGH